jgi:hypothetical protein
MAENPQTHGTPGRVTQMTQLSNRRWTLMNADETADEADDTARRGRNQKD